MRQKIGCKIIELRTSLYFECQEKQKPNEKKITKIIKETATQCSIWVSEGVSSHHE